MSLLDGARRIERCGPYLVEGSHCLMCDAVIVGFAHIEATDHKPDCPWLSMPKIVAALEAADAAVRDARREIPNRLLYPGHPLSDLALALYGTPTAIVREVVPQT